MSKPPTPANDLFQKEADGPLVADRRNFFKLELWTRDGRHVERLLFAGNSLDKAHALFASYGKKRPRARLTIRQRSRVMGVARAPDRKRGVKRRTIVRPGQHGASERRIKG